MIMVHPLLPLLAPWFIATALLCALAYTVKHYWHSKGRGWLLTALGLSYGSLVAQYINVRYAILYADKYYLERGMVSWFKLWWILVFLATLVAVLALHIVLFIAWQRRANGQE